MGRELWVAQLGIKGSQCVSFSSGMQDGCLNCLTVLDSMSLSMMLPEPVSFFCWIRATSVLFLSNH